VIHAAGVEQKFTTAIERADPDCGRMPGPYVYLCYVLRRHIPNRSDWHYLVQSIAPHGVALPEPREFVAIQGLLHHGERPRPSVLLLPRGAVEALGLLLDSEWNRELLFGDSRVCLAFCWHDAPGLLPSGWRWIVPPEAGGVGRRCAVGLVAPKQLPTGKPTWRPWEEVIHLSDNREQMQLILGAFDDGITEEIFANSPFRDLLDVGEPDRGGGR
jgi:hypothetical protein